MSPRSSLWDRACYAVVRLLGALQFCILERCVRERCWRSADGTVRRLRDMGERHLDNCRRMLERDGAEGCGMHEALRREQVRRAAGR